MTVEATSGVWGEPSVARWSAYTYGISNPTGWITLGTIYPKGTPDKLYSAEIAQIISQSITETRAKPYVPYFSLKTPMNTSLGKSPILVNSTGKMVTWRY